MGSKSRSSSSQTSQNSSLTAAIHGDNDGVFLTGDSRYNQRIDNSDNSMDLVYSDSSFTDTSTDFDFNDQSFTDQSQYFNDQSYSDSSQSFTDQSYNDSSVSTYNDSSVNTFVDAGALAASENIALRAFDSMDNAVNSNAYINERAISEVSHSADRAIQMAEFAVMENAKFLGGVGAELSDAYTAMSAHTSDLYADFAALQTASNQNNLQTVERAAQSALQIAGNVSRSDDTQNVSTVTKTFAVSAVAIAVMMIWRR